ncbi:hypothetical protein HK414_24710 [Ramlibacter terrae]|uniref:Uncharacterized protein n=1 Tax=Ramlibacter terrae TaxID=2732511 RepID=A0ABX6P5J6_9BURK|nr:hypothetical protein HK414_24710 [Ramlibacter terrae]
MPLSVSALRPLAAAPGGVTFKATNDHNSRGFRIKNATSSGRSVTFTVDNWYVRHLAIYAVYQDGAGNDIPISALPADTAAQFKSAPLNGIAAGFPGHPGAPSAGIRHPDQGRHHPELYRHHPGDGCLGPHPRQWPRHRRQAVPRYAAARHGADRGAGSGATQLLPRRWAPPRALPSCSSTSPACRPS